MYYPLFKKITLLESVDITYSNKTSKIEDKKKIKSMERMSAVKEYYDYQPKPKAIREERIRVR